MPLAIRRLVSLATRADGTDDVVLSRDGEVIKSIVAFGGSGWLAVWAPVQDDRLTISFVENGESVLECSFGVGDSVFRDLGDCDLASLLRVDKP